MKKDYKKILIVIVEIIFVFSFCIFELKTIIDCIDGFYNGSCRGLRFFGSQEKYYGLKGVEDTLEGWALGKILRYWPITIFQILYIIFFIKIKVKNLKNNYFMDNKSQKQSENTLLNINNICLILYFIILFSLPKLNITIIIFSHDFPSFFSISFIAILAIVDAFIILLIKHIAEINKVYSIFFGLILLIIYISMYFQNFYIPIFVLFVLYLSIITSAIIYSWWLEYRDDHKIVEEIQEDKKI